jgi:hypothetical protein
MLMPIDTAHNRRHALHSMLLFSASSPEGSQETSERQISVEASPHSEQLCIQGRHNPNEHFHFISLYLASSQPTLPLNKLHMIRASGHNLDLKGRMVMRQCIDLALIDRRLRDFSEVKAVQKS